MLGMPMVLHEPIWLNVAPEDEAKPLPPVFVGVTAATKGFGDKASRPLRRRVKECGDQGDNNSGAWLWAFPGAAKLPGIAEWALKPPPIAAAAANRQSEGAAVRVPTAAPSCHELPSLAGAASAVKSPLSFGRGSIEVCI